MSQPFYHLIIAGGGLAGLSLAIQMARKGFSVAVFEKGTFPKHKVCGEYLARESWPFLKTLGIDPIELKLPRINKLAVSTPKGKVLKATLENGGFGISRFLLDNMLANEAIKSGVALFSSTNVLNISLENDSYKVQTDLGDYYSGLVVGSFGRRSGLDKNLGRKLGQSVPDQNFIGVKYHYKGPFPSEQIELHVFKQGYCGISRIEDGKICVCYLTTADNLQNNGPKIADMEKALLKQNPFLAKRLESFSPVWEAPLTIAQIGFGAKELVKNGIIMAGDAAGTIAPLCGNGMSMALNASAILVPDLTKYLQNKCSRQEMELNYSSKWRALFQTRIFAGNVLQKLMLNGTLIEPVIYGLSKMSFVVAPLIGLTHGKPFHKV